MEDGPLARFSPKDCCEKYGVLTQTPDDFLVDQYHLHLQLVLDKLDDQATGISQNRVRNRKLESLRAQVLQAGGGTRDVNDSAQTWHNRQRNANQFRQATPVESRCVGVRGFV